ncbi:MAG: hypothetical protein ACKOX5_03690, partial [Bacteroidota bacterium]
MAVKVVFAPRLITTACMGNGTLIPAKLMETCPCTVMVWARALPLNKTKKPQIPIRMENARILGKVTEKG